MYSRLLHVDKGRQCPMHQRAGIPLLRAGVHGRNRCGHLVPTDTCCMAPARTKEQKDWGSGNIPPG